jgi:Ca2+-binding EF-hand superfamily protein
MKFTLRSVMGFVALGLVAVLLVPTPGLTQNGGFPGGGFRKGGGPGGGFPGGGFPGGGFSKGGFPGGDRGGRSGMGRDPNERWNEYTGGKDVWRRSEITDPNMQRRFDFVAQMVGSTNGEITRQQYLSMSQQRFGGGPTPPTGSPTPSGPPSPSSPAAAPGAPGSGNPIDGLMEARFRSYDQNGDGLLNNDEMPDSLKAERDKWDANKDGFIDLNEFKAYAQARFQQMQTERDASGRGGSWGGPGGQDAPGTPQIPLEDDGDKRPTVYRAGKLPKDMPAWFVQADTDADGQVGLYEWRAKGWPIEQFQKMDRNDDGFVTVDEALRFAKQSADPSGTAVAQASPGASPGAGGAPPGRGSWGGNGGGTFSRGGGNGPRMGNWGRGAEAGPPGGGGNFTRGGRGGRGGQPGG